MGGRKHSHGQPFPTLARIVARILCRPGAKVEFAMRVNGDIGAQGRLPPP